MAGCVQVPKKGGFDQVQQMVNERIQMQPSWKQEAAEDRQIEEALDKLLDHPRCDEFWPY